MWVFDLFQSPEVMADQPAGFDADLWYFAGVLYALVHPQHFLPWVSIPLSTNLATVIRQCVTISSYVKSRTPIPKLPEEVGEYNALFERCFDYDIKNRPDIDEVITILKGIKANYDA